MTFGAGCDSGSGVHAGRIDEFYFRHVEDDLAITNRTDGSDQLALWRCMIDDADFAF